MSTIPTDSEMVLVSKEVLKELERLKKLEEDLPVILAKTKQERDKERLRELSQRQKETPEEHIQTMRDYYTKNKEIILAKRREAYKKKKAVDEQHTESIRHRV